MAIHPDDPPWSLLGLPRVVSTIGDKTILESVDSISNGITFCTGSGVRVILTIYQKWHKRYRIE